MLVERKTMKRIKVFTNKGKCFLDSKLNDTSTQLISRNRKFEERGENLILLFQKNQNIMYEAIQLKTGGVRYSHLKLVQFNLK